MRACVRECARGACAQTLFGFPTALLNRRHAPALRGALGPGLFPALHRYLHPPAAHVREAVAAARRRWGLEEAGCSVGLQVRV